MDQVVIRQAQSNDSTVLSDIAIRSKASWGYPPQWIHIWKNELIVTAQMLTENITFVAESNNTILGFSYIEQLPVDEISPARLFIDPPHKDKGLGKILWQTLLDEIKILNAAPFIIDTDPNAETFYLKMGGVKIGDKLSSVIEDRTLPIIRFSFDD